MDEMKKDGTQQSPSGYTPRPAWQVWAARAGLVVMVLFVIYQILAIATGGL